MLVRCRALRQRPHVERIVLANPAEFYERFKPGLSHHPVVDGAVTAVDRHILPDGTTNARGVPDNAEAGLRTTGEPDRHRRVDVQTGIERLLRRVDVRGFQSGDVQEDVHEVAAAVVQLSATGEVRLHPPWHVALAHPVHLPGVPHLVLEGDDHLDRPDPAAIDDLLDLEVRRLRMTLVGHHHHLARGIAGTDDVVRLADRVDQGFLHEHVCPRLQ